MSQFTTSIPVNIEKVTKLLPDGHHFIGITFDKENSKVDVNWEHDKLVTGRTFAVDFPAENLVKGADLPEGVSVYVPPPAPTGRPEPLKKATAPVRVQGPEAKAWHDAQDALRLAKEQADEAKVKPKGKAK